jgi:hypothetical protein
VTCELVLTDGRILRTRISHPVDRSCYGSGLWQHILRDQLQVTEAEFWACVKHEVKPDRGEPEAPPDALPLDLVHLLVTRVGLSETEAANFTKPEAIARLERFWTEGT